MNYRNFDSVVKNATSDSDISLLDGLVLPDIRFGDWGLPSHGSSKITCGDFITKGCLNVENHSHGLAVFKAHVMGCYSPKCPICWKHWALRGAKRIEFRIHKAMELNPSLGLPVHVMASVPKRLWYKSIEELRKIASKMLKKAGLVGSCLISHAYRQDKKSGLWRLGIHFHGIAFGWVKNSDKIHRASGWIVKNIGVINNVLGTAFYQLTHCAVYYGSGRKASVTWVGVLSYRKGKDLGLYPMPKLHLGCPYCGEPFKNLSWVGEGDPPLPSSGVYSANASGWIETSELVFAEMWNPFKNGYDSELNRNFSFFSPLPVEYNDLEAFL